MQFISDESLLLDKLKKKNSLRILWGVAITGKPYIAYFLPLMKIADFVRAGCEVTILLADLHGFLDNRKTPENLLEPRTKHYREILECMIKQLDVPLERVKFVVGRDFQLTEKYSKDFWRMTTLVTTNCARECGSTVVQQTDHPLMSSLYYPCLQVI